MSDSRSQDAKKGGLGVHTLVLRSLVTLVLVVTGLAVPITAANAAAPSNDDFTSAQAVGSFPVSGTNVEATVETGEYTDSDDYGATVWYSFTASQTGLIRLNTCDSDFDTYLSIWSTTDNAPTGSPFAQNDDGNYPGCGPYDGTDYTGSVLVASVTAGNTYYLQVGGWRDGSDPAAEGTFTIGQSYVMAASNNNFSSPTSWSGLDLSASNYGATMQKGEYNAGGDLEGSVWFTFTADETETFWANTCDAQLDTVLTVWEAPAGLPVTTDTPLAENDDSSDCGNTKGSSVRFPVTAGTVYYVQVGNYSQDPAMNQGTFVLSSGASGGGSSADQVPPTWMQSIGREAGGACDQQQGWTPTWEWWRNEGLGGHTCYRVIGWYQGGWAVGNNSGPNGTFRPTPGASIAGVTQGSAVRVGSKKG